MPAQPVQRRTDHELRYFALELLDETDAIALRHLAGGLTVDAKPDATLVTQVDTEIEELLRARIMAAFPDHGIVGEELGTLSSDADTRWIVDPIDGTHNLVRGIPVFATLIAVERDGVLVSAAISAPALSRRWYAVRGEGAFVRDLIGERRIHVSTIAELREAQALSSGLQPMHRAGYGDAITTLVKTVWRDRGFGDFWGYMLVAEGAAEVMLEIGPTLWDPAAPALVVEEAGGRLTDFGGTPTYQGPQALATNGLVEAAVVSLLEQR